MREHDALRRPGRARRVEHDGGVGALDARRRHRRARRRRARRGRGRRSGTAARPASSPGSLRLTITCRSCGSSSTIAARWGRNDLVDDERPRVGVIDDVLQRRPARGGVDRDLDEPGLLQPEPGLDVLDAVLHHQRDVLARARARARRSRRRCGRCDRRARRRCASRRRPRARPCRRRAGPGGGSSPGTSAASSGREREAGSRRHRRAPAASPGPEPARSASGRSRARRRPRRDRSTRRSGRGRPC